MTKIIPNVKRETIKTYTRRVAQALDIRNNLLDDSTNGSSTKLTSQEINKTRIISEKFCKNPDKIPNK